MFVIAKQIMRWKLIMKKVSPLYTFIKRCFDLFASFIAILLLLLVYLIVFIAVKVNSPGPAIFKDKRIGKSGKLITVLKFRSMYSDAESNIGKYLTPEQIEIWNRERKLDDDPRITKVGKFIRKTSLDELPQFFNVFIGNMSLVGPRPISQREYNEHFSDEQKKIITSAKPGITGYWQVYARNEAEFKTGERQKLELEYFEKRSLWLDFKILILTVPAVLKKKGVK